MACEIIRLGEGETFYERSLLPKEKVPNRYSLFVKTLAKRRRLMDGSGVGSSLSQGSPRQQKVLVQRRDGLPAELWNPEEDVRVDK